MGSKIGLSARTPPTIAMLGAPKSPTQLSSEAFTMFVPATFLPVTPVPQALAPHTAQISREMVEAPAMRSTENRLILVSFVARIYSKSTVVWDMGERYGVWNSRVALSV